MTDPTYCRKCWGDDWCCWCGKSTLREEELAEDGLTHRICEECSPTCHVCGHEYDAGDLYNEIEGIIKSVTACASCIPDAHPLVVRKHIVEIQHADGLCDLVPGEMFPIGGDWMSRNIGKRIRVKIEMQVLD